MDILEFGDKSSGTLLIQPVDGRDLEVIEKEIYEIKERQSGFFTGCL